MSANSRPSPTGTMTDEERLKLADKLDSELDEWMGGLEKKAYTDGWPEDRWEEEMEKHPFFMTKFPEKHEEASPLMQGIQQLKYDENENTPKDLALSYKEDGNFNFKHKKYRMAVISYTEGIRRKCGDLELDASLYNNRSAAQYFLKNYRSSLMDCRQCIKLKPDHEKALLRAAHCCFHLKKIAETVEYCNLYLEKYPDAEEVKKLKKEAIALEKKIAVKKHKEGFADRLEETHINNVLKAVEARGIQVEVDGDKKEVLRGMHERPKVLIKSGQPLVWPVFFLYPEYSTSDFVKEFNENDTIASMLEEIFAERPDWDVNGAYKIDKLSVYYEADDRSHLYRVDMYDVLGKVLQGKGFVARDWRPAFLVFVKDSVAEKNFIKNYTVF